MNRLFGGASSTKAPPPSVHDVTGKLDSRVGQLDARLAGLQTDLTNIQRQLAAARSQATKETLRQQARTLLNQRRVLLAQREQLSKQSFNLYQVDLAHEGLQDSVATVQAMRTASKQMQATLRKVNPDAAEILGEEVSELLGDSWEVQELLGRSYDVGNPAMMMDEESLEAELAELAGEAFAAPQEEAALLERLRPEDIRVDLPPIPLGKKEEASASALFLSSQDTVK